MTPYMPRTGRFPMQDQQYMGVVGPPQADMGQPNVGPAAIAPAPPQRLDDQVGTGPVGVVGPPQEAPVQSNIGPVGPAQQGSGQMGAATPDQFSGLLSTIKQARTDQTPGWGESSMTPAQQGGGQMGAVQQTQQAAQQRQQGIGPNGGAMYNRFSGQDRDRSFGGNPPPNVQSEIRNANMYGQQRPGPQPGNVSRFGPGGPTQGRPLPKTPPPFYGASSQTQQSQGMNPIQYGKKPQPMGS